MLDIHWEQQYGLMDYVLDAVVVQLSARFVSAVQFFHLVPYDGQCITQLWCYCGCRKRNLTSLKFFQLLYKQRL